MTWSRFALVWLRRQRVLEHEIVIVGGGAAGISVAASLLRRRPGLDIVIVEPKIGRAHV